MEWEYRVIEWHEVFTWDGPQLVRDLNVYGAEGWELVAVDRPDGTSAALFILKRQKGGNS